MPSATESQRNGGGSYILNSYNGFSAAQRARAQAWLNAQWRAGNIPRPTRCCACGQTAGVLDTHAEDYSEPFSAGKTAAYHLCYVCHMMVHCRFRAPENWNFYRRIIANGVRFKAFQSRNWYAFKSAFLGALCEWPVEVGGEPGSRTVLDDLHDTALLRLKAASSDAKAGATNQGGSHDDESQQHAEHQRV